MRFEDVADESLGREIEKSGFIEGNRQKALGNRNLIVPFTIA
jgi:hypothetical protein